MYNTSIRAILITISLISGIYLILKGEIALGALIIVASLILIYSFFRHRLER